MTARANIDETRLRELWASGATCREIAAALGCKLALVSRRARSLGLPPRNCTGEPLPWNAIARAIEAGQTMGEIRAALLPKFPTLSISMMRNNLRARGVRRDLRAMSPATTAECVRLRRRGLSLLEIAAHTGLAEHNVGYRCRKAMGAQRRGEWSRTKLDVPRMLRMRDAGASQREIAEAFGVTHQAIYYHLSRA